ncbi:MAG: acyl-[acyl-carrier-protein] thioesterase [Acidobacteriota bacterium]
MNLLYRMACRARGRGPAALARLFEQAAEPHAAELGVGMEALRARGQAWMLVQLGLAVRRWPEPGEPVEVLTWPSGRTAGARAWREFEVVSASGATLAEAASVWLIVDLERRRPVRLPRFLLELDFPARRTRIEPAAVPEPPATPAEVHCRTVLEEDLDINEHVNNASYIGWAEALAEWEHLRRLQADYLGEALLGEQITVETWELEQGGQVLQRISGPRGLCVSVQWWQDRLAE